MVVVEGGVVVVGVTDPVESFEGEGDDGCVLRQRTRFGRRRRKTSVLPSTFTRRLAKRRRMTLLSPAGHDLTLATANEGAVPRLGARA